MTITTAPKTHYKIIKELIPSLKEKWRVETHPKIDIKQSIKTYEFLRERYITQKIKQTAEKFYEKPNHGRYIVNKFKKRGFRALFKGKSGKQARIDDELLIKTAVMKIAYKNLSDLNLSTILKERGFLDETSSKAVWKRLKKIKIHQKKGEKYDETLAIKAIKAFQEDEIRRFEEAFEAWDPPKPSKNCTLEEFLTLGGDMQARYEMIREVILNDQRDISQITAKHGIFQEMYYEYIRRFLKFGLLGLLNKPKRRVTTPQSSIENQILIIRAWEDGQKTQPQIAEQLGIGLRTVVSILTKYHLTGTVEKAEAILKTAKRVKYREVRRDSAIVCARPDEQKNLFLERIEQLRHQPEPIPIPAGFLIAPFLNEFRFFEIFSGLGLEKFHGYDYGRLFLLNIARVFGGIPVIGDMTYITDDGLALSTGLAAFPDQKTLHENIVRIGEENLQKVKWSITQEARSFGLFSGINTACDFHLSVFTGTDESMLDRGKGPDTMAKKCLPGPRVMLAYDYFRDSFITYRVYDAKERASKVTLEFIEKDLEYVIGVGCLRSLIADAEFRGVKLYTRLTQKGISFIFAVPINSFIKGQLDARPECWGRYRDTELFCDWLYYKGKPTRYVLIVVKNGKKKMYHCFTTNHSVISDGHSSSRFRAAYEVLDEYHKRSKIEVKIRTSIASYYFDKVPTTDSNGANFHYLSSLAANYIIDLLQLVFSDELRRFTLDTLRDVLFVKKKMMLGVEGNTFVLRSLDHFQRNDQRRAFETLSDFINSYGRSFPWLYGMGIRVES